MILRTLLTLLSVWVLQAGPKNCESGMKKCQVVLTPRQVGTELNCHMKFTNISREKLFLNKVDICIDPKIVSEIFIIKERDKEIPYAGILVKRAVATAKDFVTLAPGESIETTARLDDAYEFPTGWHQYTIQYSYYHSSPEEKPQLNKIESDVVPFTYDKK